MIGAKTKICLVIGDPIEHSLSPLMHNVGYKALGIDDKFVFLGARVKIEELKNIKTAIKTLKIRGVSCTMPHKVKIMKYLDEIEESAREIGAVNTVLNENQKLIGYNTDWIGAQKAIEKKTRIKGKKVGIIGAGGAAKAIVYGVKKKGGKIKVFNIDLKEAENLAKNFQVEIGSFKDLKELKNFDIIINATPLGMPPYQGISPLPKEVFSKHQVVMDAVYIPYKTKMLREAEKRGAKIIPGIEMLFWQGVAQFKLYTKRNPPLDAMRSALINYFKNS